MLSEKFYGVPAEKILGNATGDVAEDFYYRFKVWIYFILFYFLFFVNLIRKWDMYTFLFQEDIALMKEIGLDSFRFSISWSRVLPGKDHSWFFLYHFM